MLASLRDLISGSENLVTMVPDSEPRLIERPTRIEGRGLAIRLDLGERALQVYPDSGLSAASGRDWADWLVVDPDRPSSEVAGFARLGPGTSVLVGRDNDEYDRLFELPKSVGKRHLVLENIGGQIVVRPLDRERPTYVRVPDAGDEAEQRIDRRFEALRRIRGIFGGPIEPLAPEEALSCLEEATQILSKEAYRAEDSKGRPGGLLELPPEQAPIIVGDLHAQIDNLLKILSEDSYVRALQHGEAYLLLLGDVVHRDGDGELEEMDSSLLMLDLICKLKCRFPANVFHLRGNHESLDEEVGKGGVPQGLVLKAHARAVRGETYASQLAAYFESLPYVVRTEDFIACHAGPPRFKVTRKMLVEIAKHPDLRRELTWNRVRRMNRPEGYSKKHVRAFREALGVGKHTPLIVSHSCLSADETLWPDATGIKGLHVFYSAGRDRLAIFIRGRRGMVPLTYPCESLLAITNSLDA